MQILQRALEHPLIEALSWSLLHFLWQGAVVSGLLALILVAFRRASSHARYVVLCSGLTVMALCPVVTWVYSVTSAQARHAEHGSHLTVVSAPIPMPSTPAPSAQLQRVAVDSVRPNAASEPGPRMEQMPNPEGLTVSQDTVARDHDQAKLNIAVDLPARSHSPLVALDQLQVRLAPALPWLVIAWLTGVILLSVRMMVGWRDVQMLKQRATQSASQVWQDRMQRLAKLLRVEKPVRLVESALVFVPTVIGWLRPMILVPASAMTGLNPNQLEALLAHELAHIRRNDFLINLIQTVIETLLFYHPAVWWLSQRIRTEREHCCDDIAVQVCENSVIYARALATMEELRGRPTLTMAADGGSLLARIRRLICPTPEIRRPVWGASCITLVTVVSIGMAAYFTSRVNAAAETPESTLPTTALTVARLPGNIEVELTSVGFHPAKDRVRWTASGEKFGAISHQESELSVLAGTPDQADCREFQFKVTGLPPDHGVKMDYGTTASASSSLYERDRWIGNGAAGPFKSKSTTIRMSIATEPFGRKVVIDLQGKKLDPPEFTPEVQKLHNLLVPLKIVSAEESTELLLESQQLNALEQRAGYVILAIDVAGNEHRSTTTSTTTTSTIASGERQLLFPVPLGSLEQFEYRLRPFRHRVTFENVSLQPGQPTEVLVKTETLPEEQYQEAPAAILERSQLAKQLVTEISIASKKFSAGRMQAEIQNLTDSSRSTTARGPMAPVASALVTWLSDGQRWRINYAEELAQRGSNAAILENWSSGFDGGRNFNWDEQSNQMTIGSARGQNSRRYEPRNLFWYPLSGRIDSLLRAIAQPGTRFVKATRTGMEGYRIEFSDPQAASRRWTAFVCPQRSHLILHYQLFVDERLQWESQVSELAELEPDLWYPKSFRHVSYSWGGGGKYTRKQQRDFKVSLLQRQPEPAISKDEFALKAQVGTNVNDLTVGQEYYNDVWWSELAPYIRRELNWPKTSLSSLNYLTTSFARPIATPALPDTAEDAAIEIGAVANHAVDPPWVNSQPLTWELLNGKVTLIVFWSQVHAESIEILAALRRLHEMYAPHGLQIIAIHEPDEPGVRQTVSGLNLPFLVIADREDQSEKGVLFNQFGLRGVPTAVFVDHQHKLHPIVNAREIPKQLDELLTAAGAKDLPIAKLREELSPVQIMTVQSLWEVLVDEAPKTASIIGRVVDAVNEPIADVQIDVQLNLRLRNASSGDAILKSNQGMHRVLSDAQGQFVITQLPKGQYDLRATFTDRVPLRQSLTVSEGSEQKVTIALTLPDFVEGRVVGGNSVPIADALLKIRYQHPALNNLDYHTEILTDRPTVKTDSNGRFRFEKLDPAAVTIDVFADGYRSAIIRKVALGGSDVEIKMQLANQPEPAPAANDKAAERTPAAKPDRPANADDAQQGEQLKNPTPPLEFRIAAPAKVKEDDSVRWFPILAVKATRPEPTRDLGLPVTREEQYVCQALLANTSEHALLWDKKWSVKKCVVVAEPDASKQRYSIGITLDEPGSKAFRQLTKNHLNQPLAIMVGGLIVVAPVIRSEIGAEISLTGNFSKADAERLAFIINMAMQPPPEQDLPEEQIDPSLKLKLTSALQDVRDSAATRLKYRSEFSALRYVKGMPTITGIGVRLFRNSNDQATVDDIVKGGSAFRDGRIKQGDEILAIRNEQGEMQDVKGAYLDFLRLMRSGPTAKIQIKVLTRAEKKTVEYELPRETIEIPDWRNPRIVALSKLKPGTARAEVLKLLNVTDKEGEEGLDQMESFRLDDHHVASLWFEQGSMTLVKSELIPKVRSIWIEPPANFTGIWTTYYVNGNPRNQITYQDGKYNGPHLTYHDNGALLVDQTYVKQICEGDDTGYFPSGKIQYRAHYENGKPVGIWTFYNEDGSVRTTQQHPEATKKPANSDDKPSETPEAKPEDKSNAEQAELQALELFTERAVKNGIEYLKSQQKGDGTWSEPTATGSPGTTALATAALLEADVPVTDPAIQKALVVLRKNELQLVYTVALQTMVLCTTSPKEDAELIRRHIDWLEAAQVTQGPATGGWSYQEKPGMRADGSCTRFAVLGLHAAQKAGFAVKAETWQRVGQYWMTAQLNDGQWGYTAGAPATATMTLAGIAGLATVQQMLPKDDQTAAREAAIRKASGQVEKLIVKLMQSPFPFYALHSLERAANLTGTVSYGDINWRLSVTNSLLETQLPTGAWSVKATGESELISTSFALMILGQK